MKQKKELWEERIKKKPLVRRLSFWAAVVIGLAGITGFTLKDLFFPAAPLLPETNPNYEGGWGPERPTYTVNSPAPYAVFNSITDNPNVGDERDFVVAKPAPFVEDGGWQDILDVSVGDRFGVRVYYENSAADNFANTPTSWLHGAKVQAGFPTGDGYTRPLWVQLSADNAATVWDGVLFKSRERFAIELVENSTRLYSNAYPHEAGKPAEGIALDEKAVFGDGMPLGYESFDGIVVPGYQYAGYIYFEMRIVAAPE